MNVFTCTSKFKTHYLDQVLCGGPSFCFVLFFHTYVSSKIYEITLFRYKAQNEAKRKKEEKRRRNRRRKIHVQKNARGPATDLILLLNPGPKYVLIWGYRHLSHLLKIHFLNIFDVMSSLIHIHIITFHDLYIMLIVLSCF